MAEYSISAKPSGSSQANAQSRMINSILPYTDGTYKTINYMSRRNGVWCSSGGTSQSVTLNVYAQLLSGTTVIKTSPTVTCKCRGSGPAAENYATTEFVDWTTAESNAAIAAWAAGTLELKWFVSIKSYTSSGHGNPTFRSGQYDDVITIRGQDVPPTNYKPNIVSFAAKRVDANGDESISSEIVQFTIQLSMNDVAGLNDDPHLYLYYASGSLPEPVTNGTRADLTSWISNGLAGSFSASIGGYTWQAGSDWDYALVFTAGEETSGYARANVPKATIPIHISQYNSGVGLGGYSQSANVNDRRIDAHWPLYAHDGIKSGIPGYSTSEIPTGQTWIDGKPIYRKVLAFTSITNGSNNDMAIGASGVIGTIIRFWGLGYNTAGAYAWNIPHYDSSSSYGILVEAVSPTGGNPKIRIKPGSGRGLGSAVVVVEYTLEG